MKMTKKVLGVVLALAMLVNVFAMFSSAAAPDSAVDLYMRADKEYYSAGDTVTITVSEQVVAAVGDMRIGGCFVIGYDSSKIEMLNTDVYDKPETSLGFVALQAGYDDGTSSITWTDGLQDLGNTIEDGHGWNAITGISVGDDMVTGFDATSKTDIFTFQMKIAADCPDGEYYVGFNAPSYSDDLMSGFVVDQAMSGVYGNTIDYDYGTTENYGFNGFTIKVGAPTASSFVQYSKAQIRFAGIGETSTAADYKGTFDVRTVAKISQADFLANFTDETTAKEKITDIGFVYATTANVADFNLDTAKAVAAGTAAEGYVKAPVNYIQHAADGADYIFTCLIENIADTDKDQTVNCLGYVCFDGTYYYFDAEKTVSFNDLYKAHFPTA